MLKVHKKKNNTKTRKILEQREFEYKPKIIRHTIGLLLYSCLPIAFIYLGITNEKELIIDNFIKLSVFQASLFYFGLASVPAGFVIAGFIVLYKSLFLQRRILITEDAIFLPKNALSSKIVEIKISNISSMLVKSVSNQKSIVILYNTNDKISIHESMVSKDGAFIELCSLFTMIMNKKGE